MKGKLTLKNTVYSSQGNNGEVEHGKSSSKSVLLVGTVGEYSKHANLIKLNDMDIVGIYLWDVDTNSIDGIPCVDIYASTISLDFDCCLILNDKYRAEVSNLLHKPIIPASTLYIPGFTLDKYLRLLQKPPSIISQNCFGGLLYHYLGLEFKSPFINLYTDDKDFIKLCKNLKTYLAKDLIFEKWGYEVNLKRNFPIALLGDVRIYFNHYCTFEEAKIAWDRRKNRINYDDILVIAFPESSQQLENYSKLSYAKLLFSSEPSDYDYVVDILDYDSKKEKSTQRSLANRAAFSDILCLDQFQLLVDKKVVRHYIPDTKVENDTELLRNSEFFDDVWYLNKYGNFPNTIQDPVKHYLTIGWKLGNDPSPIFSTNGYLSLNNDVKKANVCPLVHYLKCGKKERRTWFK